MTDTSQPALDPAAPAPATGTSTITRLVAVLAGVVLLAVTVGVLLTRDNSPAGAQQLTSTERVCRQWTAGYIASSGSAPTGGWCTAMTNWMGQQLHSGQMTGPMMWSNSTSMDSTCRKWMSTEPRAASGVSPQACDVMVAWMAEHTNNWGNWMMSGQMKFHGP